MFLRAMQPHPVFTGEREILSFLLLILWKDWVSSYNILLIHKKYNQEGGQELRFGKLRFHKKEACEENFPQPIINS